LGFVYTPRSDLVTAYSLFLNAIDLKGDPNPNLDSQINIAADQLNKAQANYIDQQQKAVAAYTVSFTGLGAFAIQPGAWFRAYPEL
jgi:hypothetical protein